MTNYERVKQMSLEEMVDLLCAKGIKMWLESEVAKNAKS